MDARGKPLLDQPLGQLLGAVVGGSGRENDDDVGHMAELVLFPELVYRSRVAGRDKQDRKRSTGSPRTTKKRRVIQLLLVSAAIVIVVDGLVGDRGLLAMLRARREYDELATTIARQRAENARLRVEARRLREDPGTIEEIARRDLGLIRPGEKVFIIRDVQPAKP